MVMWLCISLNLKATEEKYVVTKPVINLCLFNSSLMLLTLYSFLSTRLHIFLSKYLIFGVKSKLNEIKLNLN